MFDFISSFLRSPPWTVPLNSFIDQHCIFFDGEEENKFIHTDLHKEFIQVVEGTLSANLRDLGISDEEFAAAVELSATKNDAVNRLVFGQILACENFLTFKKLMVKRNRELEAEAMEAIKKMSQKRGTDDEDEAQLMLALKLSAELAQAVTENRSSVDPKHLKAALSASVTDFDHRRAQIEAEQAELEHAIALSLQYEQERLSKLDAAIKDEQAAEAEARKATNPAQKEEAIKKGKKAKRKKERLEEVVMQERDEIMQPAGDWGASQGASQPAHQGRSVAPAPSPKAGGQASLSSLPPLTRVLTKGVGQGSLPSVSDLSRELEAKKELAMSEFASTRKTQLATNQAMEALLHTQSKVSDEELRRRQEFLRQQRDLLVKKKLKENENQLEQYQKDVQQKKAEITPDTSASDAKREAMRFALARRFKEEMEETERRRRAQSEEKYSSLQQSMSRAHMLRSELESMEASELVEQESERRRKMDMFHRNLTKSVVQGHEEDFTL